MGWTAPMSVPRPLPDGRHRGQRPASHPVRTAHGHGLARATAQPGRNTEMTKRQAAVPTALIRGDQLAAPAALPTRQHPGGRKSPSPVRSAQRRSRSLEEPMSTLTAHLTRRRLAAIATAAAAVALLAGAGPAAAQARSPARTGDTAPVSPAAVGAAAGSAAAHARPQAGRPLPVAAWGPLSRALGRDDPAYRAAAAARGLTAANPAQRLRAWFAGGGALIRSGPLAVGLGLRGVGSGPRLALVRSVTPVTAGNRVTFRYGRISEWFANGPLGLERGFTLTAPAPGQAGGPLTLAMALSGNARAAMLPGHAGVVFSRAGSALAYRGLVASDARGTRLPAWLALRGRQLLLHVQAAGARYPLTVDPVIQQARLTASDGAAGDSLGAAVAISANGNTMVAGAPYATINGNSAQGAVYVFTKPAGGWQDATEAAKLTASDGAAFDNLGSIGAEGENGVAISSNGSTVVAGASGFFNFAPGAVYVFTEPNTGWRDETQAAKLTASDAEPDDNLGFSVGISGNVIVSGAPEATVNGNLGQGAVYVFTRPSGGWHDETQAAKLTA